MFLCFVPLFVFLFEILSPCACTFVCSFDIHAFATTWQRSLSARRRHSSDKRMCLAASEPSVVHPGRKCGISNLHLCLRPLACLHFLDLRSVGDGLSGVVVVETTQPPVQWLLPLKIVFGCTAFALVHTPTGSRNRKTGCKQPRKGRGRCWQVDAGVAKHTGPTV